eukprot:5596247-Amphidinium_carterae.2
MEIGVPSSLPRATILPGSPAPATGTGPPQLPPATVSVQMQEGMKQTEILLAAQVKAIVETKHSDVAKLQEQVTSISGQGQPWPWQLLEVRLAPIPKGEGRGHIYPSWSWLRAKQASEWLSEITNYEIHGGIQGRSTFDVLTVASNQWHLAESNGEQLGQLLLDSSKWFDTLSHEALLEIGQALRLPEEITTPFCSFVSCHVRVLCLRGWVGPSIYPQWGVPQGDSLSVLYAVVWAMALRGVVRAAVPSLQVSLTVYLDDVSIASSDHALLLRCFAAAQCFMDSWKVCLNVDKTQLLLSTCARVEWPEVFAGVEVLGSAKLLGVEIEPVLSGGVLRDRLEQCLVRLERIRLLPFPLNLKRRLVASFACPLLY